MKLSGKESCLDLWILSRLRYAVETCNAGFQTYDFPAATTACYNFWLYDLCDIYLEYLKPVFSGDNANAINIARNVLYTSLDVGLRLISPFMPFISEELFQRLPRRTKSDPPSICVTSYPEHLEFPERNLELEENVEFIQKILHTIRSTRSDYNLPKKVKSDVYIRCTDYETLTIVHPYVDYLRASACTEKMVISASNEEFPAEKDCAILTVSDKCQVYLLLKGLIDPQKEILKLEQKQEKLNSQLKSLKEATDIPDYEAKVPEEIRIANQGKLQQLEGEITKLIEALSVLKTMDK